MPFAAFCGESVLDQLTLIAVVMVQDDAFTESHMTTIGVDFVSINTCSKDVNPATLEEPIFL